MRNIRFFETKEEAKVAEKRLKARGIRASIFKMSKREKQAHSGFYSYYVRYEF